MARHGADLGRGLGQRLALPSTTAVPRHDVAQALAALAGGQHDHEPDQVEADAVDHAQDRAQRDLALVGRAAPWRSTRRPSQRLPRVWPALDSVTK